MKDVDKNIPVVILAGGKGTRLGNSFHNMPKPLVRVGIYPILLHIMSIYSRQGFLNFVICGGYKVETINQYFCDFQNIFRILDVQNFESSLHLSLSTLGSNPLFDDNERIQVTIVDTGLDTTTAGRLKLVQNYISSDYFLCTYGDGLAQINLTELIQFHISKNRLATLTGFHPPSRFGQIEVDSIGIVQDFQEKPLEKSYVNGGFFVFKSSVLDLIDSNKSLEDGLLSSLTQKGELTAFLSDGFWQMMDTPREVEILNDIFSKGMPPWNVKY
jgi:glucose-1-phosphate cytidylyltransferase